MLFRPEWIFFEKLLKFFQQVCWNCNLRVNSKHLMRKFLIFFIITFALLENYFVSFSKIFWRGCQKLHFFVQKNNFLEHFFGRLGFFIHPRTLTQIFLPFPSVETFQSGSLNWNLHFHRNFLKEKGLFGTVCVFLLYLFSHFEQKVLAVLRYFSRGVTKAAF